MNLTLLLSATLFLIVYLFISTKRCLEQTGKLPTSISMTFYNVPIWLFVSFLLYSCGIISILNLSLKPDDLIISNIGAWLLAGVGFMSNIKNIKVFKFHIFGAILGFVLILLGFWLDYSMPYITIFTGSVILSTIILLRKKHFLTWVVEIVSIIGIIIGYFILI